MDVIIVEDDTDLRDGLVAVLSAAGRQPVPVANAETALPLIDAADPPHLVVTDIQLGGGMDGWEFGAALHDLCPKVPIVYISGRSWPATLGAHEVFLAKPFTAEALLAAIRGLGEEHLPFPA